MNTLENILEYADIENIPVRKWMYMNIIVNNKNLDLYINGYLKIRKELSSLPKQNDDDFWVSMFGGFEGYISNIRYYSHAIDFNEINSMIKQVQVLIIVLILVKYHLILMMIGGLIIIFNLI